MAKSMAIKDSARIMKLVRQKAYAATLATLEKAAHRLLFNMEEYKKYLSATGNTWASTSVGIFYKGRLVSFINMSRDEGEPDPVRETLAKNERFDLADAYEESPRCEEDGSYPFYYGEYGKGGQDGPSLAEWHIHRIHPPKYKTWCMYVIIPVSYAGYKKKIVATLQAAMDDLPNVIDYNIVRVQDAPSQTDAFKDVPL